MKKIMVILVWSWASLAQAGIYISGGGGVTEGTLRYSQQNSTASQTEGEINGMGQLGIGFADNWGKFFGGIEIGAEWQGFGTGKISEVTLPDQSFTGTLSTELNNDYYLHVKPGYVVNDDFVLYGLLGVLKGQFTLSDVTGDIGNETGPTQDVTRTGYRIGLGIANKVKNHFEWRFEYTYNGYAHIDSTIIDKNSQEPVDFRRSNIAINQVLFGIGFWW